MARIVSESAGISQKTAAPISPDNLVRRRSVILSEPSAASAPTFWCRHSRSVPGFIGENPVDRLGIFALRDLTGRLVALARWSYLRSSASRFAVSRISENGSPEE